MQFRAGTDIRFPRLAAGEPGRAGGCAALRASGARPKELGSQAPARRARGGSGKSFFVTLGRVLSTSE